MVFIVNAFFQIPSSSVRAKQKEVENEEKTIDGPPQKAEVNGNMDCFSLIIILKVSEKSGKSQGIFNFLMSGNPGNAQMASVLANCEVQLP